MEKAVKNNEALNRLFGKAKSLDVEPVPSISGPMGLRELPIDMLTDMDQPFRIYAPAELEAMRQSVIAHGIIQRIIVRPHDGKYQIISGRHRRTAAKLAGYVTVPCEVRELTDDEALLQMLETNLRQREKLLPSEKAWAYRQHLEAANRQGMRTDLTQSHCETRLRSDEQLGIEAGESRATIQRYVRLTYLLPALLECVDEGRLGLTVGESLSHLSQENQAAVYQFFFIDYPMYISQSLADNIRHAGEEDEPLTATALIALTAAPPGTKALRRISIPVKPLRQFFPPEATQEHIVETIEIALADYFKPRKS